MTEPKLRLTTEGLESVRRVINFRLSCGLVRKDTDGNFIVDSIFLEKDIDVTNGDRPTAERREVKDGEW